MKKNLLLCAWKRLLLAYIVSLGLGLLFGYALVNVIKVEPETIINVSTKRISYVDPILEFGTKKGFDKGLMLFFWNALVSFATLSFIYTASWFNPGQIDQFPRPFRKFFCSKAKMKLLCHLPGCSKISSEPLRRLHLWLSVPYFGLILLGTENGLSISTAGNIFGSLSIGLISLLPHGIIEIPAISFAGAVAFSAHLKTKEVNRKNDILAAFQIIESYRADLPIKKIAAVVIAAIFIAGIIEAHVTLKIIETLAP